MKNKCLLGEAAEPLRTIENIENLKFYIMDKVEVLQLIKTTLTRRGKGVEESPIRIITQYWDFEGNLIFEVDPFLNENENINFK